MGVNGTKAPLLKIHLHLKERKWQQDPGNALFSWELGEGFRTENVPGGGSLPLPVLYHQDISHF